MAVPGLKSQRGYVTLAELMIATALTGMVVLGVSVMQTSAASFLNSTATHLSFNSYFVIERMSRWVELGSEVPTPAKADEFMVRLDYDDNTGGIGFGENTPVKTFTPKGTATEDDDMWLSVRWFHDAQNGYHGVYYIKKYNAPGNTAPPAAPTTPASSIELVLAPVNQMITSCNFTLNNPSSYGLPTVLAIDLTMDNGAQSRVIHRDAVVGASTK